MPSARVAAAAPGLPSRRTLLAGVIAVVAPPAAQAKAPPLSSRQRMAFHLAEFRKAAEEADPSICDWITNEGPSDSGCALVVAAYRS